MLLNVCSRCWTSGAWRVTSSEPPHDPQTVRSVLKATCTHASHDGLSQALQGPTAQAYHATALAAQVLQLVGTSLLLHNLHQPGLHGRSVIGLPAILAHPLMCLRTSELGARSCCRPSASTQPLAYVHTWMSGSRQRSRSLQAWQEVQMTSRSTHDLHGSCRAGD